MKSFLKFVVLTVLLNGCAGVDKTSQSTQPVVIQKTLTEKVQELIVETQEKAVKNLPETIQGLKSVDSVSNREKNQKGAGFTRVYTDGEVVATVFVYNDLTFGIDENVEKLTEEGGLMEKHLAEFSSLQDSGLYSDVKIGEIVPRAFRWYRVNYNVLQASVSFLQKEESKRSLLVLGGNKELMSYIRIRYTYPKSKQAFINKIHAPFTRVIFVSLHNFMKNQK